MKKRYCLQTLEAVLSKAEFHDCLTPELRKIAREIVEEAKEDYRAQTGEDLLSAKFMDRYLWPVGATDPRKYK